MFEQAIQLDKNFALAYAGIAHLCGLIFERRDQSPDWLSRGITACDRAMALAPDLPEVMVARARLFYAQKKFDETELMARRAIERKHDCDGSWNILGRDKDAENLRARIVAVLRQQLELVPEDVRARVLLSSGLAEAGEVDESIR